MQKTILITGSTDGIGLETAKRFVKEGHNVLIHGRSLSKLKEVEKLLDKKVEIYLADLSDFEDISSFIKEVKKKHLYIDVLINNAGVYKSSSCVTKDNLDIRFMVNTIAPYSLSKELFSLLDNDSRVINLSSAAQAPVNLEAIKHYVNMSDGEAYAQSKLALTMWSSFLGKEYLNNGPMIVSVNPKSLLGSKMVKSAYGIDGADLSIGANILARAALSDEFKNAHGRYFDNDIGQFSNPHNDALDMEKCKNVVKTIEEILKNEI